MRSEGIYPLEKRNLPVAPAEPPRRAGKNVDEKATRERERWMPLNTKQQPTVGVVVN